VNWCCHGAEESQGHTREEQQCSSTHKGIDTRVAVAFISGN
jgi:hypothetical protein